MTQEELMAIALGEAESATITWDTFLSNVRNKKSYNYKNAAWYRAGVALEQAAHAEPIPPEPNPSTALWIADMSTGDLSQWTKDGTGGFYNSGTGVQSVENGRLKMTVTANNPPNLHAVRAFAPWSIIRANREVICSAEIEFPVQMKLTGPTATGHFMNMMQIKSKMPDGSHNDPIWSIVLDDDGYGGVYPKMVWGNTGLVGPYPNSLVGWKSWQPMPKKSLPVGAKTVFKMYMKQSKDFDGAIKVWQDDTIIFDFMSVRTSWPNPNENSWGCHNEWSVNLYTDGISPAPFSMYVDNAKIELP